MVINVVVHEGADKKVAMVVSILVSDLKLVLQSQLIHDFDQFGRVQAVGVQEAIAGTL